MDAGTIAVAITSGVLGGGGMGAIVLAFARRKVTKAEATEKLTDSAIDLIAEIRTELTETKREAASAKADAQRARQNAWEAGREMAAAKDQALQLTSYLRRVLSLIHDPAMTMERLRTLVDDPGTNGVGKIPSPF